jgi:hypothetical protein
MMRDIEILIGFEFIIFSALLVAAGALLLAEWFVLSLFPLAVVVLIGAVIIDAHLLGRWRDHSFPSHGKGPPRPSAPYDRPALSIAPIDDERAAEKLDRLATALRFIFLCRFQLRVK